MILLVMPVRQLLLTVPELELPVKFIGVGEQIEDLVPFSLENYLYGLIGKEKVENV